MPVVTINQAARKTPVNQLVERDFIELEGEVWFVTGVVRNEIGLHGGGCTLSKLYGCGLVGRDLRESEGPVQKLRLISAEFEPC